MAFNRATPVTNLLLVAIGLGFAGQLFLGDKLVDWGANYGPVVWRGEYWRLLTSMFLHGGFVHLFLNGWALYQLGGLFEMGLGSRRLLLVYFVSGIAGSLASAVWSENPSVGASGAIFGILGTLIAFLLRQRDMLTPQAKSLLSQLMLWAGINVLLGFSVPRIDNAAHLGGFVAGLLLGLVFSERQRARLAEV